ncbi:hypothetical protein CKO15_02570 [Halorhodospira abdelmalekii]|uniref:hypothetical protein n=1 Tax=Halorhodospira abdelmalekii TaxID=421629 RepID=UPI001906B156|nr:hypothetical protein [Halorhodospira abdelmalekii]MBK1734183.1 hypothetical protein [Halorhodospira abdelmalekii]
MSHKMLARKTDWNEVQLPPEIAGRYSNIDYFEVVLTHKGRLLLAPVPPERKQQRVKEEIRELGIEEDDIRAAARALLAQR